MLTRTAITLEAADSYADPVILAAGDPRLVALTQLLDGLALEASTFAKVEIRTVIRIACRDGKTSVITASRTEADGRVHLDIDGRIASTRSPFRRPLEELAASALN